MPFVPGRYKRNDRNAELQDLHTRLRSAPQRAGPPRRAPGRARARPGLLQRVEVVSYERRIPLLPIVVRAARVDCSHHQRRRDSHAAAAPRLRRPGHVPGRRPPHRSVPVAASHAARGAGVRRAPSSGDLRGGGTRRVRLVRGEGRGVST